MSRPSSGGPRLLVLSAEALTVAERLGQMAGVSADNFVEGMLLELFLNHHEQIGHVEPLPIGSSKSADVVPISRARKGRRGRGRSPLPPAGEQ
jgi:hypothetical protein